jgi:nitrogen fixation protein FixH
VAQHKHSTMKGPNGGPMADVAGVHAELTVAGNTVTINLFDETNKPVSSKGFSGSALIVSGTDRETVTLAPAGDSALKGEAKKAIAAGASTTIVVKNAAGKSGQARF